MLNDRVFKAVVTIILSTMFITAFMNIQYMGDVFYEFFPSFFSLLMLIAPIIIIYGIPIAILSDFITKRVFGIKRILLAFIIYLSFGMVFGVFLPSNIELTIIGASIDLFVFAGAVSAFIFWFIEEYSKCRDKQNSFKQTMLN